MFHNIKMSACCQHCKTLPCCYGTFEPFGIHGSYKWIFMVEKCGCPDFKVFHKNIVVTFQTTIWELFGYFMILKNIQFSCAPESEKYFCLISVFLKSQEGSRDCFFLKTVLFQQCFPCETYIFICKIWFGGFSGIHV